MYYNKNEGGKKFDMDEYISQKEREHMLFELHRYLAWVGIPLPDEVTIDGHKIKLHDLIWKLIQKKKLTEAERKWVRELIRSLEQKEHLDEEMLEKANLTRAQAERIQVEAAGLLRAIMDLKDLEEGRIDQTDFTKLNITDKVEDARRWVKYIKQIKE